MHFSSISQLLNKAYSQKALSAQPKALLQKSGSSMQPKITITRHFAYRRNSDNTVDSICLICFQTIATASNEGRLLKAERRHKCKSDSHLAHAHTIQSDSLPSEETNGS
jgi:hypothetical protein